MKAATHALGRHILLELYQCPTHLLERPRFSENFLLAAAKKMNATIVESRFHAFSPHGVSGVVVIQESHLTIHTWPEYQYAAIDIFSCGALALEAGVQYLIKAFEADTHDIKEIARGLALVQEQREKI